MSCLPPIRRSGRRLLASAVTFPAPRACAPISSRLPLTSSASAQVLKPIYFSPAPARGFVKPVIALSAMRRRPVENVSPARHLGLPGPMRVKRSPIAAAVAPADARCRFHRRRERGAVFLSGQHPPSVPEGNGASSPPEATFISGPGLEPGLVLNKKNIYCFAPEKARHRRHSWSVG